MKGINKFWALASVVLITMLLRPPVAGIGPILGDIQTGLRITGYQAGMLAALPVLCFGLGAFAGPQLVRKIGLSHSFTLIIGLILVSLLLRPWFGFVALLVLSVVLTLAIAVANVLFPTLIRAEFPKQIAGMTSLYTSLLALFASLAASVSVPLLNIFHDWRWALFIWSVPAVLALVSWLINASISKVVVATEAPLHTSDKHVWLHPITWSLVGFFGLQSLNFYAVLNWLPAILQWHGYTQSAAGAMLGLTTVVGIPSGLLVTANLKRFKSLSALVCAISCLTAVGLGLLLTGGAWLVVGCLLIGIGLASTFPISLALVAMKAHSRDQTTLLSALVQGFGYLLAALGTFAAGLLNTSTGSWVVSITMMTGLAVVQAAVGIYAGSNRTL